RPTEPRLTEPRPNRAATVRESVTLRIGVLTFRATAGASTRRHVPHRGGMLPGAAASQGNSAAPSGAKFAGLIVNHGFRSTAARSHSTRGYIPSPHPGRGCPTVNSARGNIRWTD